MKKSISTIILIIVLIGAILSAPQLSVGATPAPLASDGFSQLTTTDGLGDANYGGAGLTWTGSTWNVVPGGTTTNAPTMGTEMVTNGSMEAGNPPTNWTATNSTLASVADQGTGGTGTQSVEVTGTTGYGEVNQSQTFVINNWYYLNGWGKVVSTSGRLRSSTADLNSPAFILSSWSKVNATGFITQVGQTIRCQNQTSGAFVMRCDDISLKQLTLASLFRTLNVHQATVTANVNMTLTAGTDAGLVLNLDSSAYPNNFILAYHDGTNVHLVKVVAGVYTSLINTAATYVAGAKLTVSRSGNVYTVTYNGSQVGSPTTISDNEIINNTLVGLFDTYGNTFDNFTVYDNTPTPTPTNTANETQTIAVKQTLTAAPLTATAAFLTQAAIPPITQTHQAGLTQAAQTAIAQTATAAINQTSTAYVLTLTAGGPTSTFTPSVTPGLIGGMPTFHVDSGISYGDYASVTTNVCLILLIVIIFIAWLVVTLLIKGRA